MLVTPTAHAAPEDLRLTPDRIDAGPSLNGPTPRGLRFAPDGRSISYLQGKSDDPNRLHVWTTSVDGGAPVLVVDADTLAPSPATLSEAEKARRERQRVREAGVVEYSWDEAGERILVPLDGDLYLAEARPNAPAPRQITDTSAYEIDARVSPGGRYASFVRENTLYAYDTAENTELQLSPTAEGAIAFGVAEFVAQEELDRHTGYWWSPTDRYVAYTRVDESPVALIQRPEISAEGVTLQEQRYPRAGAANAIVRMFVRDMETGTTVEADLGADTDVYLARATWMTKGVGETLVVQRLSRDQTRLDVLAINPTSGGATALFTDDNPVWINLHNDLRPLKMSDALLWSSERSGHRHLYLYDADGDLIRPVTRGDWAVKRLVGVDEDKGLAYFEGFADTPLETHLYRVSYSRDGAGVTRITTPGSTWSVTMNGDATRFIGVSSNPNQPPQTGLYDADGTLIRWIEENQLDQSHPYAPYVPRHATPDFGELEGEDGAPLHYQVLTPSGCSADAPCPAILSVYGGPHAQTVTRGWTRLTDQMLVHNGFVVFRLDNRGSANRGLAFEAPIKGRLGDVEVADQLRGLTHLKSLPFVDAERVGVFGWSYGGYMTLKLMAAAPEAFAAGVAGAPVTDWALYDTGYTERYLGTPQGNPDGYAASAALAGLEGLKRPLLVMHGMADDNVVFDHSTRLFKALQDAGVVFETAVYPGERHGLYGAREHMAATYLDFFRRRLAP